MLTKKVNHQQRQRNRDRQGIDRERIEPETEEQKERQGERETAIIVTGFWNNTGKRPLSEALWIK